ncbi:hypothetical protein HCH52_02850 [Oscillospiraceae bacterium HV4-5-C5C]|nr:hypothetical protein [Oscillospiraceae bacterium HV4-5-C5C]
MSHSDLPAQEQEPKATGIKPAAESAAEPTKQSAEPTAQELQALAAQLDRLEQAGYSYQEYLAEQDAEPEVREEEALDLDIQANPASVVFYNETVLEKEDLKELVKLTLKNRKGVWLYRIFLLLFGAFFTFTGVSSLYQGLTAGTTADIVSGILLTVLSLLVIWFAAYGLILQTYRRMLKHATDFFVKREYTFTPDMIRQIAGDRRQTVHLREVSGWQADERCFFLKVASSFMIVRKDAFKQGTAAEFEAFLKERISQTPGFQPKKA